MTSAETVHEPSTRLAHSRPVPARQKRLGFALFAPPAAWSMHLALEYGLVYPAARHGSKLLLYGVSVVALLVTVTGLVIGLAELRRHRTLPPPSSPSLAGRRFLAESAVALGAFFTLVVIAQTLPVALLGFGD